MNFVINQILFANHETLPKIVFQEGIKKVTKWYKIICQAYIIC